MCKPSRSIFSRRSISVLLPASKALKSSSSKCKVAPVANPNFCSSPIGSSCSLKICLIIITILSLHLDAVADVFLYRVDLLPAHFLIHGVVYTGSPFLGIISRLQQFCKQGIFRTHLKFPFAAHILHLVDLIFKFGYYLEFGTIVRDDLALVQL